MSQPKRHRGLRRSDSAVTHDPDVQVAGHVRIRGEAANAQGGWYLDPAVPDVGSGLHELTTCKQLFRSGPTCPPAFR